MNRSPYRVGLSVLLAAIFCVVSTAAFAQGSTSQALSGSVVDTSIVRPLDGS